MKKTYEQIQQTIKELASYTAMMEELEGTISEMKEDIKKFMSDQNLTELLGENGSKIYWKEQVQSRFDSSSFKKSGYEELYRSFCKESIVRPFKFYK